MGAVCNEFINLTSLYVGMVEANWHDHIMTCWIGGARAGREICRDPTSVPCGDWTWVKPEMGRMALIAGDSAAAFGQSSERRYLDRVAMKGGALGHFAIAFAWSIEWLANLIRRLNVAVGYETKSDNECFRRHVAYFFELGRQRGESRAAAVQDRHHLAVVGSVNPFDIRKFEFAWATEQQASSRR
jgi:hypothetical protein